MRDLSIPRHAERALAALGADRDFCDAVLGDLAEEFAIRATWDGAQVARRWYYRESLRVAPHLLRSWWRGIRARGIAGLASAIAISSVAMMAFETVVVRVIAPALGLPIEGRLIDVTPQSPLGAFALSVMLVVWTSVDGAVAGFVAARVGRRAPLASAISCAAFWGVAMLWSNFIALRAPVPLSFRVFNTLALVGGVLIGGLIRSNRRTPIGVVECQVPNAVE
jgi:hypothetical protein